MIKRLFFFMILVPMVSLCMGEFKKAQVKRAHSDPTTISEYQQKVSTTLPLKNTKKKNSSNECYASPIQRLLAKRILVRGKNYSRDFEFTDSAQDELFKLAVTVNERCLSDKNECAFIERRVQERGHRK